MKCNIFKILLFCSILFNILLIFLHFRENFTKNSKISGKIPNLFYGLKNILADEAVLKSPDNHQIFLIETHLDERRILANPRQACTVESAGKFLCKSLIGKKINKEVQFFSSN